MNAQKTAQLESLLGRPLSVEEKERLRRIKDTLHIADNDAMWDILTAMEYQRKYYEELPEKITLAAAEIFKELSVAAENEVALAQSRLAEAVVEQAKILSTKMRLSALIIPGLGALVVLLLFGCLLMWAGYCIGAGGLQNQTQPLAMLLRMPSGVMIGGLCFSGGIFSGVMAAKDFAMGYAGWKKWGVQALGFLASGTVALGLTVGY